MHLLICIHLKISILIVQIFKKDFENKVFLLIKVKVTSSSKGACMKYLAIFILTSLVAGCAEFNSIYRQRGVENDTVIAIDAKQRFLIRSMNKREEVIVEEGLRTTIKSVTCVEPSPDAFSVYAAALEGSASKKDKIDVAAKLATNETGATIGLRTESIQLLRDAMYRLCEGYAAGGINRATYQDLLSKYQKSMVSLIAISQLTGAVKPQQVVIGSSANIGGSGESLIASKEKLDMANKSLEQAEKEAKTAKATFDEADALEANKDCKPIEDRPAAHAEKCKGYDEALKAKNDTEEKRSKAEKSAKEWEEVFEKIKSDSTLTTDSTVRVVPSSSSEPMDAAAVRALGTTVENLVSQVFFTELLESCINKKLSSNQQLLSETGNLLAECMKQTK
jgi:hypothetical protein